MLEVLQFSYHNHWHVKFNLDAPYTTIQECNVQRSFLNEKNSANWFLYSSSLAVICSKLKPLVSGTLVKINPSATKLTIPKITNV